MNAYLLAAMLLTTPAWVAPAATLDERWHMKDQSRMVQTPLYEQIYDADEFSPIDAMAKPLPAVSSIRKSLNRADVCQRVGKRKVVSGKTWRCR